MLKIDGYIMDPETFVIQMWRMFTQHTATMHPAI